MISSNAFSTDLILWSAAIAGPVIGALLYWLPRRTAVPAVNSSAPAINPIQPTPVEPDHSPVPNQRGGIPSTALVRIHDACNGMIKDGELDIRFELRSRRDCDKMLEVMRGMKENLSRAKTFFGSAEDEIRAQLDNPAVKNSARVRLFGKSAAEAEDFIVTKQAELDGYERASRLVDKFIFELGGAEVSLLELPFYTQPAAPVQSLKPKF